MNLKSESFLSLAPTAVTIFENLCSQLGLVCNVYTKLKIKCEPVLTARCSAKLAAVAPLATSDTKLEFCNKIHSFSGTNSICQLQQ